MLMPDQKEQLIALGKNTNESTENITDLGRQYFSTQIRLIDIDMISRYLANYLSDPNYKNNPLNKPIIIKKGELKMSETLMVRLRTSMIHNPSLRNCFSVITTA
jgi:hypothetical protein